MAITCSNCGHVLTSPGVTHCPACGGRLTQPSLSLQATSPPAASANIQSVSTGIIGIVNNLMKRIESHDLWKLHLNWTIWTFVVQQFDPFGNQTLILPVEMRGLSIHGVLNNGDNVEIKGAWQPGETAYPDYVRNLSTGATVRARFRPRTVYPAIVVTSLVIAVIWISIVLQVINCSQMRSEASRQASELPDCMPFPFNFLD